MGLKFQFKLDFFTGLTLDKIIPSFGPFAGGTTVTVVLSDAEGFDTSDTAVTMETNERSAACTKARYER